MSGFTGRRNRTEDVLMIESSWALAVVEYRNEDAAEGPGAYIPVKFRGGNTGDGKRIASRGVSRGE
jgi:hypothetical protein